MHPDFDEFWLELMETTWEEMCEGRFMEMILRLVADRYGPLSPEWHEARSRFN